MDEIRVKMGQNGRLVIPAEVRKAMGMRVGQTVILHYDGNGLSIISQHAAVRRVQEAVREINPEAHSLVDDLLAERRADAGRN